MLALNDSEIKSEDIPVHMHHDHTEIQQTKDNNKTPTVMVHAGQIKNNHNTTSNHLRRVEAGYNRGSLS